MPQENQQVHLPNTALNDELIRVATSTVYGTGSEDETNARWDSFKTLCESKKPNPRITANMLQYFVGEGSMKGIRLVCNINEQNKPATSYIENALNIARNQGHPQIARYFSCELIRRNALNADSLQITQDILQDFIKRTSFVSCLFSSQTKAVQKILSKVKRAATTDLQGDTRYEAVTEAVTELKKIMGKNKDLITCVDFIEDHLPQQKLSASLQSTI